MKATGCDPTVAAGHFNRKSSYISRHKQIPLTTDGLNILVVGAKL